MPGRPTECDYARKCPVRQAGRMQRGRLKRVWGGEADVSRGQATSAITTSCGVACSDTIRHCRMTRNSRSGFLANRSLTMRLMRSPS